MGNWVAGGPKKRRATVAEGRKEFQEEVGEKREGVRVGAHTKWTA